MKLLQQYEEACKLRHFALSTQRTYAAWVVQFLRFHRQRSG